MHYQVAPAQETKIVKCLSGRIHDVIIEVSTGRYLRTELSCDDNKMLYVPEGYAHGFQTLEDNTVVLYLSSQHYDPYLERGINHNVVDWPLPVTYISKKDAAL